jgi:hypothetical protein
MNQPQMIQMMPHWPLCWLQKILKTQPQMVCEILLFLFSFKARIITDSYDFQETTNHLLLDWLRNEIPVMLLAINNANLVNSQRQSSRVNRLQP